MYQRQVAGVLYNEVVTQNPLPMVPIEVRQPTAASVNASCKVHPTCRGKPGLHFLLFEGQTIRRDYCERADGGGL